MRCKAWPRAKQRSDCSRSETSVRVERTREDAPDSIEQTSVPLETMVSVRSALKVLFACSLVAVSILSLLPPNAEPSLSFLSDKLQHASAYAWLALIGAIAYSSRRAKMTLLVMLPIFGAAIELVQYFVPDRTPELADAIANLVGVLLGLALVLVARQFGPTRGNPLS